MSAWPRVRLDECTEVVSGATPDTSESGYWGGDICWATPKDLSELESTFISDTPRKITQRGLESCAASILPPESVLFSSRAPIGHVAINTVPMATNQGFKSFVPNRQRVEPKFLYHWLRKNRSYIEKLGNGATFKEVSKAVVSRIEIALPPVPEQRRISKILDKADALTANRRAAMAELELLSQPMFLEMFGDPIANPRGFPVKRLIDVVDPQRPITYGILKPGPNQQAGVKYVRVIDMKRAGVALSDIRITTQEISNSYRRSLLKEGDLLLSIRGHVGRLAIVPRELNGANITQDTARLSLKGIDSLFVRECLKAPALQQWMSAHTKGVAVRGINLGDVKLMPIIDPPADEQRQFRRIIEAWESLRSAQSRSLDSCEALVGSLQHQAFSGLLSQ